MRFHFVMLLIVIFVSLGMHTISSAGTVPAVADVAAPSALVAGADRRGDAGT